MKKLMITMVAALASGWLWAKGVEQVSVVENEITTISVPFGIKGYTPSNKDVARIEAISDTSLRVTALRRGRCDLEVRGDKGLEQKFEITVLGDLATVLDTLTSELDQVQEVRARIVGNTIRIDGEIGSISKWEYLMKVLRGYGSSVRNFATFAPGPEILLRMKETLQQAGFEVVFQQLGADRRAWKAKTIALALNKQTRIMSVQGKVYTPEQQKLVMNCLASERWLSLKLDDVADSEDYRIRSMIDVFVDKPKIRLSVAYMAIGESDLKKIGNPVAADSSGFGVLSLDGTFGVVRDFLTGFTRDNGTANVGASLGVTARFFKNNGISRISDTGYTMMESWSEKGAKFKSGGTLFVRTISSDQNKGGGASINVSVETELKEIPYGFELDVKGGLVDGEMVDVDVEFKKSAVMKTDVDAYDRKEDISQQKITLPIGRTTFLGGVKMIEDERTSPSGLPIFRNTPLLNWFVADSGTEISDRRLVIMVCPEIIDGSRDGNLKADEEVNIPVTTEGVKTTEQREEEKKPFSGFWYWLNWFTF